MSELRRQPLMPCAFRMAQVCQAAVGHLLDADTWPDFNALHGLMQSVPRPRTCADAVMASTILYRFIQQAGVYIHARVHKRDTRRCEFSPARYEPLIAVDLSRPDQWNAASVFRTWARVFDVELRTHHPESLTRRAQDRLRISGPSPIKMTVTALARDLGCSLPVLRRQFQRDVGEAPGQYAIRLRVCTAFDLLRETGWTVESVAHAAGWKSKKDLYLAFRRTVQMTPVQIRTLKPDDAANVRVRLTQQRRTCGERTSARRRSAGSMK